MLIMPKEKGTTTYNLQDLGTQGAKYRINEAILPITWIKPRYNPNTCTDCRTMNWLFTVLTEICQGETQCTSPAINAKAILGTIHESKASKMPGLC